MTTDSGAAGAQAATFPARAKRRRAARAGRIAQALCGILLGVCTGCGSSAGDAPAMPPAAGAALLPREPAPLMAKSLLLKPVDRGRLTSGYGTRYHPVSRRRQMHQGIDWAAPRGTIVRAGGDGVVVAAGRHGSYGHYLRIDHGGTIETAYAHLERYAPKLRPGHAVRQGDEVGRVGSTGRATGPHLHYEVLVAGERIDPLAFAPPPASLADSAPDPATGSAEGEFGIGGPDIAAEAQSGDADPQGDSAAAPPPEAIDAAAVIWIDDLLSRRAP